MVGISRAQSFHRNGARSVMTKPFRAIADIGQNQKDMEVSVASVASLQKEKQKGNEQNVRGVLSTQDGLRCRPQRNYDSYPLFFCGGGCIDEFVVLFQL